MTKQVDVELEELLRVFYCHLKSLDGKRRVGKLIRGAYGEVIVSLKSLFKEKARECVDGTVFFGEDKRLIQQALKEKILKNIDDKFK